MCHSQENSRNQEQLKLQIKFKTLEEMSVLKNLLKLYISAVKGKNT